MLSPARGRGRTSPSVPGLPNGRDLEMVPATSRGGGSQSTPVDEPPTVTEVKLKCGCLRRRHSRRAHIGTRVTLRKQPPSAAYGQGCQLLGQVAEVGVGLVDRIAGGGRGAGGVGGRVAALLGAQRRGTGARVGPEQGGIVVEACGDRARALLFAVCGGRKWIWPTFRDRAGDASPNPVSMTVVDFPEP